MNLRRLAFKNVWRSRGRYLAYLGSAAFSVAIYFLYAALTHHPALRGGFPGAEFVPEVANAAAFVIAVFTLLFLLYSGAAFVRYRMKEFGLLTLLGFSRGQLVRMILWENLVVAATALAVGLGAGLLFLKLFFMAISAVLHLPQELPLYAGTPVWTKTLAVFGAFFAVVSLLGLREVLRRSVIQLIQARRQPKESPRFSFLKAAAGLCLVVAGYAWASAPSPNAVIAGVVPVTVIVSIGTYLLFREGFIAALTGLRRREQLYMRPKPFLVVSQLLFKLQDNYRVLSAVSLLIAVILSAVGTIYSLYVVVAEDALNANPHPIQLTVGPGDPAASAVRAALERHGVSDLREVAATLLKASVDNKAMYVVANSVYRSLQRPQGEPAALAGPHEAIVVYPFGQRTPAPQVRAEAVLSVGGETLAVSIVPDLSGRLINGAIGLTPVAVVDDAVYAKLARWPPIFGQL
ncbi:MAG: hypothetical protein BAA04_06110 [Firmicutes bacterium ZCTH02-B6]|nr:MAG: hypothetical protein BAA04_06110 [Firmicutes bacterium ZCTH02-B6]